MIIVGYQGIGKSTLAKDNFYYIDLESSSFLHNGNRPENWHIYYAKIAEHLSKQGYNVFVSSHDVVRNYLRDNCNERIICIYPSLDLEKEWLAKLENRYYSTIKDKDYRAWVYATKNYKSNIKDLKNCGIPHIEITDPNYNLLHMIEGVTWQIV